jgi:ribonucleoside-triphosphate reductase (thioredoxin)
MTPDRSILSDITVHMKYARFSPEKQRRETWTEIVERNKAMHVSKFNLLYNNNIEFKNMLDDTYDLIHQKRVLPSMRSMQFGGKAIEVSNNRVYNCAFMPIDSINAFSEAMFLLLGGSGVGYSVQYTNINKLPSKQAMTDIIPVRHEISDDIEGWADAVKAVVYSQLFGFPTEFSYSQIRPKGAILKTSGGRAPGHEPLKLCLEEIQKVLESVEVGERMSSLNAHDIMCYLADAVLSGGIRRAAMISLFDKDDDEMLLSKWSNGDDGFWTENPQRMRANNSVVLDRATVTKADFEKVWSVARDNNSGEPGFYFTNDTTWGTNPCCEIALKPHSFCNLTEINVSNIQDKIDLAERVTAAAFLGTLQASYTDFHYLREVWKTTTEEDALVGVSMTGIASGKILEHNLVEMSELVKSVNKKCANMIGINSAARTTCVKPAGTTSLTLGTSSGIHAWHNEYYIRRLRVKKSEPIYNYLYINHPDLVEDDTHDTDGAVISVPQMAPNGSILRTESALDLLNRVKKFSQEWIKPGHIDGHNSHNVSATVSVRPSEWNEVSNWMWQNREAYNGIAVLPYDGGVYVQAPFEDCSEETYNKMYQTLSSIDLTQIWEEEDQTSLQGEIACAGGVCEIDFIYQEETKTQDLHPLNQ